MILEMTIVKRQILRERKEQCPRCGYINSNVTAPDDWNEWQVPPIDMRVKLFSPILVVQNSSKLAKRDSETRADENGGETRKGTSVQDDILETLRHPPCM